MFKLKYKVPPFGNRTGTLRKVKLKYLLTPPREFRVTFLFGPYWRGVSLTLLLDEMTGHICEPNCILNSECGQIPNSY